MEDADTLVLFLHGMNCGPETIKALIDKVAADMPTAELLVPTLPFAWFKCFDLGEMSRAIADYVMPKLVQRRFKSLVLAGHSAGGVLVQSVYLDLRKSFDFQVIPSVRLVLIAPITRGWSVSHHLPFLQKISWLVGLKTVPLIEFWEGLTSRLSGRDPRPMWLLQLERGSPFIVGLRLRWLACPPDRPAIFILVGSVDEIVSWRDMVDEIHEFSVCYREVPYSNHAEIVDVENPKVAKDPEDSEERKRREQRAEVAATRAKIILEAMTCDPAVACAPNASATENDFVPWDTRPPAPDPAVERMVFVIHGIRDEGHWTQKIAARARKHFKPEAKNGRIEVKAGRIDGEDDRAEAKAGRIEVETSSYGYFSMLEFLSNSARQKKIHWLMDEYVEAKRRFPNARFSYISHSNGTYLLAKALLDYPHVEFERIAFAGSVVSSAYQWSELLGKKRVSHVLNFAADNDCVVSFFPRMVEIFPPIGRFVGNLLGGAGVLPFKESEVKTNAYVIGGHGAAIQEWNWDNLAKFAVSNPTFRPPDDPKEDHHYTSRARFLCSGRAGQFVTPVILVGLILLLGFLGYMAWINPFLFWLVPLAFLGVSAPLVALYASRADSGSFSDRKRIMRRAGVMMGVMAAAVLGWFFAFAFDDSVRMFWKAFPHSFGVQSLAFIEGHLPFSASELRGVLRSVSLGGFCLGVWKILTKV